jgi:N-acetylglutamate synthase-like GNAT family acetyltransferase
VAGDPTMAFERLEPGDLGGIVDLIARTLPDERLSTAELDRALFGADQPAVVRGDPTIGAVATVRAVDDDRHGFIRLLAVDPDHRSRGVGRALLAAAEADLSGATSITVGADAPFFLFPGVPVEQTAMLVLLERARYERAESNFNMTASLDQLADDPGAADLAGPAVADEVRAFVDGNYPHWTAEVMRALAQGSLLVSRDDDGALLGFCALEVNRAGLLGPIAVRLDRLGRGDGGPLLLGGLHRLRAGGLASVQVCWVGPIPPYARVGGEVSRVFFVYRKRVSTT